MLPDSTYTQHLLDKGIRPSVQRLAIYRYLVEHRTHPTVDMVYSALSPAYPTLSRTTVYNTLHLFTENRLITSVKIEDDEVRYDAELAPHIHFKCTECGAVTDIMDERIPPLYKECMALTPAPFVTEHAEINLWGICERCRKAKDEGEC